MISDSNFPSSNLSKNTIPNLTDKYLPRENIVKIMDSVLPNQIVCFSAPFGYGKTQTALQWLSTHNYPTVFCSLGKNDNSMDAVLKCLITSFSSILGYDSKTIDYLNDEPYQIIQSFLLNTSLSVKDLDNNYVFIIKNLHCLTNSTALKFLKDLVDAMLGYWHVLIISREELPPVFNNMILTGKVRNISVNELSLNAEEIKTFFIWKGGDPDKVSLNTIEEQTKGWFAALNAIVVASGNGGTYEYNQTAKTYVMRFFETEIWVGLDKDLRDFLMKTSVLENLSHTSCQALTTSEEPEYMLYWLYTHGFFILKKNVYEYHPAFKEFLQYKLKKSDIDINGLYIKLAWWLYEQKDYPTAFRYFYNAKFFYGINKMLKEFNLSTMKIEDFLDMSYSIVILNPYDLKQYPNIVAKMALIEFLTGNIEKMKNYSKLFREWTEPGVLPIGYKEYSEFYWEVGWLLYFDPDESQLNNKRLEAFSNYKGYAPHLETLHLARTAAMGFASLFRGVKDFSSVTQVIEEFVWSADAKVQDIIYDDYAILETHILLAEYYYETDRLAEALEETRKLMPAAASQVHAHLYFVCTALLVKIMRALNNGKEISAFTDILGKTIKEKNSFFLLPNFRAFKQLNHLKSEKEGFLEDFLKENEYLSDKNHFYLLYRKTVYVRTLLSLKNYHQALIILDNLEILCEKYKRVVDLMEVCVLKSIAFINTDNKTNAVKSLKKALEIGEPYGYIRVFSDNAEEIIPVLALLNNKIKSNYLKKIIISAKKGIRRNSNYQKSFTSNLTNAELKILKSLQDGLSYKEMALEHNVKLSTIRTHVQSAYNKLGVNNRTSAVTEAINHGILK